MRYREIISEAPLRLDLSSGKMRSVPMDDDSGVIRLRGFDPKPTAPTGSLDAFLAAIAEVTFPNPLDGRQRVFDGAVAEFTKFGSAITLKDIRSLSPGGGRAALKIICDLADEHHVTLDLYAKGYAHTPTPDLVKLYQGFGFTVEDDLESFDDEDGHEDDYHDSDQGVDMVRQPQS